MYTNGPGSPVPTDFLTAWYAGPDGVNISQSANGWNSQNRQRYVNAEYDALYDQLRTTADAEQAAQIIIQMNDILVNDVAIIPQVNRAADKYAISNRLRNENVALSSMELDYWNVDELEHGGVTRGTALRAVGDKAGALWGTRLSP